DKDPNAYFAWYRDFLPCLFVFMAGTQSQILSFDLVGIGWVCRGVSRNSEAILASHSIGLCTVSCSAPLAAV
ncbi:hypothetical protein ABTM56_20280, partial [Acinetobacter baumannii]